MKNNKIPIITIDLPNYFNPNDSYFIDKDVKDEFENKSYSAEQMINIQLIKTMKQLLEAIRTQNDKQKSRE